MSAVAGYANGLESERFVKGVAGGVLALWFLGMLAASVMGGFDSAGRPPIFLGVAAVLPVGVFLVCLRRVRGFREFVLRRDEGWLTIAHAWRIGGIVFLILWAKGMLPGVFAWSAGLGDMAIGVTAPVVAWGVGRRWRLPRWVVVGWHVAGILDLVVAVVLGTLSSESSIGILADGVTTRVLGLFPMSLIPTFFVPLLQILHLAVLAGYRRKGYFLD